MSASATRGDTFRLDRRGCAHQYRRSAGDLRRVVAVTSCIDTEGYSLGQAFIKLSHAEEGTSLLVFVARRQGAKASYPSATRPRCPPP